MSRTDATPGAARAGRRLDAALEVVALAGAALGIGVTLLKGPLFGRVGVASLRPLLPPLLLCVFGLLAWRARRAGTEPRESPGLGPGRWLAGLGVPDLVPLGVFFLLLLALPPAPTMLGADGQAYLEQLGGILLRGQPATHFGVEPGASLLWAPFFSLGHVVALAAGAAGLDLPANGESEPYRSALRLGAAVYGFLAAVLAQRAAARFVPPLVAAVCAAGFWLGSSLLHYTLAEPAMAHAPATAVSSLLLLLWLRAREAPDRAGRWLALGLVGGLLVSLQRYDVYLLLPAALAAASVLGSRSRSGDPAVRRRALRTVAGAAGLFLLALLPLALLALASPDRFLLNPGIIRSSLLADAARPHVLPLLFSSNGGLFAWTPLAMPAVAGLFILARRDRATGLTLLVTLALGVYLLASNPTWWSGWSFGARRLTEAYPLLVVGLSVLADAALRRPAILGLGLLGLLVVPNVLFSRQVQLGRVERGDAVSFVAVARGAATDFHAVVGHPGSWPASWIFAWRHGVSPGRFDELYGRAPRASWNVRVGSPEDAAVMGRGWSRPVASEAGGRWAEEDEATLLVTLTAPADRRLRLRGEAPRHPEGREQVVAVQVNGHPAGRFRLTPEGTSWGAVVPAAAWRPGLNEVRLRSAWRLSREEAWATDQAPFVGWKLEELAIEPAP